MNETDCTVRCVQCPYIRRSTRLEYYPNYYCKMNGQEVSFNVINGWDQMNWCPLKEGENSHGRH